MKKKTWVTSDIHFYHTNILKFCAASRPFHDVEEMNETIVQNWNGLISPIDDVYILGDVAFTNAQQASRIVNRCHGNKILIKGNHDIKLLREPVFTNCFTAIHDYIEIGYKEARIVMFHYPIWEWDQMFRGSIHLHGHTHARLTNIPGRIKDVSMDGNNCMPFLLDDVVNEMLRYPVRGR